MRIHLFQKAIIAIGIVLMLFLPVSMIVGSAAQAQVIEAPEIEIEITKKFSFNPVDIVKGIFRIVFGFIMRLAGGFFQPIIDFLNEPVDQPFDLPEKIEIELPENIDEEVSNLLLEQQGYSFSLQAEEIWKLIREAALLSDGESR